MHDTLARCSSSAAQQHTLSEHRLSVSLARSRAACMSFTTSHCISQMNAWDNNDTECDTAKSNAKERFPRTQCTAAVFAPH
eukprot:3933238-Rhodomonas_salina.10